MRVEVFPYVDHDEMGIDRRWKGLASAWEQVRAMKKRQQVLLDKFDK